MVHAEVIKDINRIEELRDAWNELFSSGEYEPSVSFEWFNSMLLTSLKDEDTFLLLVLKDSEEIVGIVPLVIRKTSKGGQSLLNLFPLCNLYNTHSDILLKNSSDELIKLLVRALFNLEYKWDVFRIQRFVEYNPIINKLESYLKETSIKYKVKRGEPSFFIKLDGSYREFLEQRSANFRKNLRKAGKKMLTASGEVKFLMLEDFSSISDAYKSILEIEKASWKHSHGTAISSFEHQKEFFRILFERTFQGKSLHLLFLYLNNEPIAYDMGLIRNSNYFYLKTSFKEKYRRDCPSMLLRAQLIENLFNEGLKEVDFIGEPYEWQTRWTKELRWHKSLLIYNKTLKGRLFPIFDALKYKVKIKQFNSNKFEYRDPRDLKP